MNIHSSPAALTPTHSDIVAAAGRLAGHAVRTPLLESPILNEITGGRIFLKAENLQRTGSFKFRGAFNTLSQLDPKTTPRIVAASSGNHAQGVAEAARLLGFEATIIMPSDAPQAKLDRTRRSGADVIEYDRQNEDREQLLIDTARKLDAVMVHPFNNPQVIAGQGTCGLEAAQQIAAQLLSFDRALVCTGGGGLLAGTFLALSTAFSGIRVHPVEPEGFDDYARSLKSGRIESNDPAARSICDAIISPSPGEIGFSICKEHLADGLMVDDEEALAAVAFAFNELKLVVEPGGAVCLAALLAGKIDVRGESVFAVLSGGNIDADMMMRALKTA